jgi:hypothetical protein
LCGLREVLRLEVPRVWPPAATWRGLLRSLWQVPRWNDCCRHSPPRVARLQGPQVFTPPYLVEKILTSRSALEGERLAAMRSDPGPGGTLLSEIDGAGVSIFLRRTVRGRDSPPWPPARRAAGTQGRRTPRIMHGCLRSAPGYQQPGGGLLAPRRWPQRSTPRS